MKSKDGIEVGSYQTSGVNDDVKDGESKPREGSAKSNTFAHPRDEYAHKRPMTG